MKYFIVISLFVIPLSLSSQVNLHYFNGEIPQAVYLNPAHYPRCKVIVGIPLINGIGLQAAHSGFTYNQLFDNQNGTVAPDPDNALKKLGRKNYFQLLGELSDLYVGIKYKDIFFNFSVRERLRTNIFYNEDMIRLGIEGNVGFAQRHKMASLRGSGGRFDYFRQYSIGAAYRVDDYLTLGASLNILFGKANMFGYTGKTGLFTDSLTYELTITADARFNSSGPVYITTDENGNLVNNPPDQSIADFLLNRQNKGISIDLGFVYENDDDMTYYGSILDLGLIRYKTNPVNYRASGDFVFNGIPEVREGEVFDQNYMYELVNEMYNATEDTLTNNKYTSLMPMRTYLGAQKMINDKLKAGVLLGNTFFRHHIQTYAGLHAEYKLGKHFYPMASWSFAHRSFKNLGVGFSLEFLPFNFYMLSDNVLGFFLPRSSKSASIQFGFNLKFGCKDKIKSDNSECVWMKKGEKDYRKLVK